MVVVAVAGLNELRRLAPSGHDAAVVSLDYDLEALVANGDVPKILKAVIATPVIATTSFRTGPAASERLADALKAIGKSDLASGIPILTKPFAPSVLADVVKGGLANGPKAGDLSPQEWAAKHFL